MDAGIILLDRFDGGIPDHSLRKQVGAWEQNCGQYNNDDSFEMNDSFLCVAQKIINNQPKSIQQQQH